MIASPIKALIDGDALVFQAGFATETSESGTLVELKPEHFAFKVAKDVITRILADTGCTEYRVYLGDKHKSNFRYEVAKTQPYKEQRKKQKRPEHEQAVRNYLFQYHNAIEVKGMEVDDALGIEQCEDLYILRDMDDYVKLVAGADWGVTSCGNTIICSNDKDLDMIPGWHYDLDYGKIRKKKDGSSYKLKSYKRKNTYYITDPGFLDLRRGDNKKLTLCGGGYLWFCAQLLMGDKTDNIPSLSKGYGPSKVYSVLKECKEPEQTIKTVYKEYVEVLQKTLTTDEIKTRIIEIARLVWIKRKATGDIIFPRSWLDV